MAAEFDITFFNSATDPQAYQFNATNCIGLIKGDGLMNITSQYRLMQPGKQRDKLKKNFKAVCWSAAAFKDNKRSADNVLRHSGLLCLDIDKLEQHDIEDLWNKITSDPYTFFAFISPSGNGIKVVIQIDPDINKHLAFFQSLQKYYLDQFGVTIDPSGKDVSRLCFVCHDRTAFSSPSSLVYKMKKQPDAVIPDVNLSIQEQQNLRKNTAADANAVFDFTQNRLQYAEGSRNNFLYLFACNCNRKGISQGDAEDFAAGFAFDLDKDEVSKTISSAYKNHSAEFGKYAPRNRAALYIDNQNTPSAKSNTQETQPEEQNTPMRFWSVSVNDKTGKESYSLNYTNFYNFLEQQGFCNLKIDNQNVELVQVKNNIVMPVIINKQRNDVKTELNRYCQGKKLLQPLEMLHRGQSKYFSREQFLNLGYRDIDFLKDEKDVSYHFHSNCVVEVRAEGIHVRDYKMGEKCMWASQINPRPFTRKEVKAGFDLGDRINAKDTDCEFAKYQILVSCHPDSDVTADVANKRYLSHATSFGYLINNYKPVDGPAIVGADHHKAFDRSEQNGRTGKGIFSKALGHITKRFPVDGRKFDPKDQSVFESLTMDSKVITVDDCHARFDFGHFFVPVTEEFSIRKMYVGYITIPYEISPKWYFNTNFTFAGDGDSFSARQHVIEFDNFFNKDHTPIHYFGHTLFREWTEEQWNMFYNYAYECDCLYKMLGLVKYEQGNYLERKLINECPTEFIDFMDATDEQTKAWLNVVRKGWFDKKKFLENWNLECRANNINLASSKAIYSMLKKYCLSKGLGFYSRKTNGTENYWIGEGYPMPLSSSIKTIIPPKDTTVPKPPAQVEMFQA
jgi:hypothetical protein